MIVYLGHLHHLFALVDKEGGNALEYEGVLQEVLSLGTADN
jgi:hypothetical protein